jgi:hypothetical protein
VLRVWPGEDDTEHLVGMRRVPGAEGVRAGARREEAAVNVCPAERKPRYDHEVRDERERQYAEQRGRKCEAKGCPETVRYSKPISFCVRHEPLAGQLLPHGKAGVPLPGLRRTRERAGYSVYFLSQVSGYSETHIERLEKGERGAGEKVVRALCRALGVGRSELCG